MATRIETAEARWLRLIQIIEEMGFQASWREPGVPKTYHTRDYWLGVGSAYITLRDGYTSIDVRISDHAQMAGGGMRYDPLVGSHYRAGESDVSIHPGSPVTLRNVRRYIAEAIERRRREDELDD